MRQMSDELCGVHILAVQMQGGETSPLQHK